MSEHEGFIPPEVAATEKLRTAASATRREYDRRIEAGELRPGRVELNYLNDLLDMGEPVCRGDLKNQAIVLSRSELEQLGGIELMFASGDVEFIDPESVDWMGPDDRFITFPDELGD